MNCKGLWSTYLLGVYVGFEEGGRRRMGIRGGSIILGVGIFELGDWYMYSR